MIFRYGRLKLFGFFQNLDFSMTLCISLKFIDFFCMRYMQNKCVKFNPDYMVIFLRYFIFIILVYINDFIALCDLSPRLGYTYP